MCPNQCTPIFRCISRKCAYYVKPDNQHKCKYEKAGYCYFKAAQVNIMTILLKKELEKKEKSS